MKPIRFFAIICSLIIFNNSFAQTPAAMEADLLVRFKKISYWKEHSDKDEAGDQLFKANADFAKKLQGYAQRNPATITQSFNTLVKEHLDVVSSADGLFRIYSWDTETGGTMHFFANVFQYKAGAKTLAIIDTPKTEGDNCPNYNKIYTFKNNGKTYYLAVSQSIGSNKDAGQGIQIFAVANDKLNAAKLIKTNSGLHSALRLDYDFFSVVDWNIRPDIAFNPATQTISLPLVAANGKVTHQTINYHFNGQYFEKIKG